MAAALLTNRSSRPLSCSTRSNNAPTAASSVWSSCTGMPPSPASVTVLPVRYTRQPAPISAEAIPRPAPRLAPVTTATCFTGMKLRLHPHRFVNYRQLAPTHCVDDRPTQRRTGQEQAATAVAGHLVGIAALEAIRGCLGIPLHARLIPTAFARQDLRAAAPAGHRHHRRVGVTVVRPNGHQAVPAAVLAARLALTTFIHSSCGLVVSSSYS